MRRRAIRLGPVCKESGVLIRLLKKARGGIMRAVWAFKKKLL